MRVAQLVEHWSPKPRVVGSSPTTHAKSIMIKIKRIEEPVCQLLDSEDKTVGWIRSYLQLNDIRIQIKMQGIDGYHILWRDYRINIDRYGNLSTWPRGFYDQMENQLMALLGF